MEIVFAGKPIIGIAGGIGSGKSFVARVFGEIGCRVIDADEQVSRAYRTDEVKRTLVEWWGPGVLAADGQVDRAAVARIVFSDPAQRLRLEGLLHPLVADMRDREMAEAAQDALVLAFVWDVPLLFEAGLHRHCDAVVFVETPLDVRLARCRDQRGWNPEELARRENFQLPLDNKRRISDYIVRNDAGADQVRTQVREILSRVLAGSCAKARQDGLNGE